MPGPYRNSDRFADDPTYDQPTPHTCIVCGTTVLMTPREAFDADWDAPPWFPYTECGDRSAHSYTDVLIALESRRVAPRTPPGPAIAGPALTLGYLYRCNPCGATTQPSGPLGTRFLEGHLA